MMDTVDIYDLLDALQTYQEAKRELATELAKGGEDPGYFLYREYDAKEKAAETLKQVLDTYIDQRIAVILNGNGKPA